MGGVLGVPVWISGWGNAEGAGRLAELVTLDAGKHHGPVKRRQD